MSEEQFYPVAHEYLFDYIDRLRSAARQTHESEHAGAMQWCTSPVCREALEEF